jgi:hypothetical protein
MPFIHKTVRFFSFKTQAYTVPLKIIQDHIDRLTRKGGIKVLVIHDKIYILLDLSVQNKFSPVERA